MAKFFELTDENQNLVSTTFQETGMHNYINLKMVGVPKAKELIKVSKANPLAEYVGKCPDTIVCAIYEDALSLFDYYQGSKFLNNVNNSSHFISIISFFESNLF